MGEGDRECMLDNITGHMRVAPQSSDSEPVEPVELFGGCFADRRAASVLVRVITGWMGTGRWRLSRGHVGIGLRLRLHPGTRRGSAVGDAG